MKKYKKHGYATRGISKIYRRWYQMNDRCYNPKNQDYRFYGGRGIRVCKSWRESIQKFIDDMGMPDDGMTLERINNKRGYSKSNCQWATRTQQMNNTRITRHIKYNGEMRTISDVSKILGVSHHTLWSRYFRKKRLTLTPTQEEL